MNHFAQKSVLRLKTKLGLNQKSIIDEMYFTPPLKILQPFYEKEMTNIMLLSVSAGMMAGDHQEMQITIGERNKIKLSSQSYEKIHNTQDSKATRITKITLEPKAFLNFTPLPTIPFANSSFDNQTTILMQEDSVLHYGEIFCAGRVARGEKFAFKSFNSRLLIYQDDTLVFFDNTRLNPQTMDLENPCMFDSYTHFLHLIIFDSNKNFETLQEKITKSSINASLSVNAKGGIIIKALHHEAQELLDFKESLGF